VSPEDHSIFETLDAAEIAALMMVMIFDSPERGGKITRASSDTIVPLKLDFEPQKKGHGRLGRVETGLLTCS